MADVKTGSALDIAADVERAKIRKQFAHGLKELRLDTGMTFAELAAVSGTHAHNLMKFEQGAQIPMVTYTLPYLLAAAGFTMKVTFERTRKVQVRTRERLEEMIENRTVKAKPRQPKHKEDKPDAKAADKKKEAEAQKKRRDAKASKTVKPAKEAKPKLSAKREALL